jgi:hypothetical protein
MRQSIHRSLLRAPVEIAAPIRNQPMHEFEIGPIGPRLAFYGTRPTYRIESPAEITQDSSWHADA